MVETATVLAGPSVGMFFAECGARVVKVENPASQGDVTRKWKLPQEDPAAPVSAYFSSVNWGKEHRFLDLTDDMDRGRFDELIKQADVLVSNHMDRQVQKLGLQRDRLKALNPRLVHGHVRGYVSDPQRPAYDVVLQAESGYLAMTGTDASYLAKIPVAMIDMLAAHQLKEGLLLALWQRERTGRGAYVETSLEEAALSGLINQATNFLMAGHVSSPMGTLHPNIAPYGEVFACADGSRIILAVGSDLQFHGLCAVLGAGHLASDGRFAHNSARVANRHELGEQLAPLINAIAAPALLAQLHGAGVPAGRVNAMDEALGTETARRMLRHETMQGVDTTRLAGNAFRLEPY